MRKRTLAVLCLLPLVAACGALHHGILNAQGPVSAHERHLFATVSAILLFVWVPVVILVPLFAWHYRLSNTRSAYRPNWNFSWSLEGFIWLPPIGIVVLLAILLWPATQADDPYTRRAGQGPPVRVQAIALDWKWVFVYPDAGIATVNQLAVPAGRPIHVEMTSGTVMQSLLLPQLAGQIVAMAGMRTRLNFSANHPGRFVGENVQYSGNGFPAQKFPVIAMPPADFARWTARTREASGPGARRLDGAAWAALSKPGTARRQTFSSVPAGFFAWVLARNGGEGHMASSQKAT